MFARRLAAVGVVVVGMLAGMVRAEEPVTLRYRMDRNDKLIFRMHMNLTQKQAVAGQDFTTTMISDDVSVRTLLDVDDKGNLHIQSENKRLKVTAKLGPLGEYTFDSTKAERDTGGVLSAALNPLYDRLNGAITEMVISPRGRIVTMTGQKELLADVLKNNPLASGFASGGSDEAQKEGARTMYPPLPEEPVTSGDKWEQSLDMELPKIGKAEGKRIYTYRGLVEIDGRKLAKIDTTDEMSFNVDLDLNGAKVTGTVTIGNSSGTIHFDPAQGQIVSSTSTFTTTGNITATAGDRNIPVQMEQTQTITVTQLKELPQ